MDWVCDDDWRGPFSQSMFSLGGIAGTLASETRKINTKKSTKTLGAPRYVLGFGALNSI